MQAPSISSHQGQWQNAICGPYLQWVECPCRSRLWTMDERCLDQVSYHWWTRSTFYGRVYRSRSTTISRLLKFTACLVMVMFWSSCLSYSLKKNCKNQSHNKTHKVIQLTGQPARVSVRLFACLMAHRYYLQGKRQLPLLRTYVCSSLA